ncbi:MAG: thymidylate kinase, partial [Selenomonas sp.]
MQTKGKLLVLEAGDGSGKATQTKMLEERLAAEGRRVRQVEFPDYESPSSRAWTRAWMS